MACPRTGEECLEFMCGSSIGGICGGEGLTTISLNKREAEVLNTLLSAEIMKLHLSYGNKTPERLQTCYDIRDKLVKQGGKKNDKGIKGESHQ